MHHCMRYALLYALFRHCMRNAAGSCALLLTWTHVMRQMSDAEKQQVAAKITAEARQMAQNALRRRLREIELSEFDSAQYDAYVAQVAREISALRVVLEGVEARAKERVWLGSQSSGDLDDRKLVETITGDRNVYKKRAEQPPQPGSPQEKPKRIRFVLDISGSMYRFNHQDKRLDRLILSTVMIMEAFEGFEHKYHYSIVGHSGDSPEIPLVDYIKPPRNRNERLKILQKMKAHSEYCVSGDSTVDAVSTAVDNVVEAEADEYFVFAVSDANLRRYGIRPQQIQSVLTQDVRVNAIVIFIASFADEADAIRDSLAAGQAFVCLDTAKLPGIFKNIFTSTLLKDPDARQSTH
eukprot:TRINITY_DN6799_c0_g1_i1.p1 TRINITY_DN6799_c0_g1~~TRINITY_DN6799_c0_g1_i1.p1  ORF type:complete len:352 (+),score=63.07 TRINITY_DN6799_c0_g1_i1:188-1243(+)